MTNEELKKVLEAHAKWVKGEEGGVRADLSGANLSGANLRRANLRGADLCGANLSYANLVGSDLSRADISGANLRGANLSRANISGADLRSSDLRESDLRSANLRSANLRGTNQRGADLRFSDLSRADLSHADLYGSNLSCANLSYAHIRDANLIGSDLSCANLDYANLSRSDLSGADLYGVRKAVRTVQRADDEDGADVVKTRARIANKQTEAVSSAKYTPGPWEVDGPHQMNDGSRCLAISAEALSKPTHYPTGDVMRAVAASLVDALESAPPPYTFVSVDDRGSTVLVKPCFVLGGQTTITASFALDEPTAAIWRLGRRPSEYRVPLADLESSFMAEVPEARALAEYLANTSVPVAVRPGRPCPHCRKAVA